MDLGAELRPRYPGHQLCIGVSLATPSQEISQLVQVSARPPAAGQYQLHKADMVSFKEPSPPREVWAAEVSKSCPRQEESPMLAAGCWLPCPVQTVSPHSHPWIGEQAGSHSWQLTRSDKQTSTGDSVIPRIQTWYQEKSQGVPERSLPRWVLKEIKRSGDIPHPYGAISTRPKPHPREAWSVAEGCVDCEAKETTLAFILLLISEALPLKVLWLQATELNQIKI